MLGITPRKRNVNIGPRINQIKKNCRNEIKPRKGRNKEVRIIEKRLLGCYPMESHKKRTE